MIPDLILLLFFGGADKLLSFIAYQASDFTLSAYVTHVVLRTADILRLLDAFFPASDPFSVMFADFLGKVITLIVVVATCKIIFMIIGTLRGTKVGN
jgi:hypothetical protein